MQDDTYLNPNDKARWGYAQGEDGKLQVGPQTVGETGGVEHARSEPRDKGALNNGGGEDSEALRQRITELEGQLAQSQKPTESSDPRTKDQLKAELDAKGVTYPSNASKADLLALLNPQQSNEGGTQE